MFFGRLFAVLPILMLLVGFVGHVSVSGALLNLADTAVISVNPSNMYAKPGCNLTVQIVIENVMGLYGFDVQLSWDPTVIQYMSHQKMIPVESYAEGILHSPTVPIRDNVDETAGMPGSEPGSMYWLAEASILPAATFSGSGMLCTITFKALKTEACRVHFTYAMLSDKNGDPIECTQVDGHHLGEPPEHDISVQLDAPRKMFVNESTLLNVTLRNNGLRSESMVELKLLINGTNVNETVVESLPVNSSYVMRHLWIPAIIDNYNIEALAVPVLDENFTADNIDATNVSVVPHIHDVAVLLDIPEKVFVNESALLSVTLFNNGFYSEEKVELELLINGIIANRTVVENLIMNGSYVMRHLWVPTISGKYVIEARAVPVSGENVITDNVMIRNIRIAAHHDVSVLLEMPQWLTVGVEADLQVEVANVGEDIEPNIHVQLIINGSTVKSTDVVYLWPGIVFVLSHSWKSNVAGKYNVTAYVQPVEGEASTQDNRMTCLIPALEIPPGPTVVFMTFSANSIAVGDMFTVSVNIANVEELYGLDIQLSWDPTVIQYLSHHKTVPVEAHLGGVLHAPTIPVKDDVDETAHMPGSEPGTMYWLAEASMLPAPLFEGHGTFFTITFRALRHGDPRLAIKGLTMADMTGSPSPVTVDNGIVQILARGQGDVNDDGVVDILDLVQAARSYYAVEGQLDWNQFADLAPPWKFIDICDLVTISSRYGKKYY